MIAAEPVRKARTPQDVTVVVLTHNRADDICRTVANLLALPERPPIIVVDNASDDGTSRRLREQFPNLPVVSLPLDIGAAGRNAGLRRATTPYVAFCGDDTWWAPGSLTRAVELLEAHPSVAMMTARVVCGPDCHDDPICAGLARTQLPDDGTLPGHPLLGFLASAAVGRREALMDVGGFEPRFLAGGEARLLAVDLAAKGWAVRYVPELVVHHCPSLTADPLDLRQMEIRNSLWFSWLRRPAPTAIRETFKVAIAARRGDALSRRALKDAMAELSWALHRRHVLPKDIERGLRMLEHPVPAPDVELATS